MKEQNRETKGKKEKKKKIVINSLKREQQFLTVTTFGDFREDNTSCDSRDRLTIFVATTIFLYLVIIFHRDNCF